MAEAKQAQRITFFTPKVIAIYPWLNKADTKYNSGGTYRVGAVLPADTMVQLNMKGDPVNLKDTIDAMVEEQYEITLAQFNKDLEECTDGKKKAKLKTAIKELVRTYPYKDAVDDEGEPTGDLEYTFKSNATFKDKKTGEAKTNKITLVDAKKKPTTVNVYGGSGIKIKSEMFRFGNAVAGAGVSLRINAVQVIDLVSGSGGAASGFDEEDGYEANDEAPATKTNSQAGTTDGDEEEF